MPHALLYPWNIPQPSRSTEDTWKPDFYVSHIIEAIGKSTKRKYRLQDYTYKTLVQKHQFDIALENYCSEFSSSPWSEDNRTDLRLNNVILRGDLTHTPRKWHITPHLDAEKDPAGALLLCAQLADLMGYCHECHACPALLMLLEDDRSMQLHLHEHEGFKRKEAAPLNRMMITMVFAPEIAPVLLARNAKSYEVAGFLQEKLPERYPAGSFRS